MTFSNHLRLCQACHRPLSQGEADFCGQAICQTRAKVFQSARLARMRREHRTDLDERTRLRVAEAIEVAKERLAKADPDASDAPVVADIAPYIDPGLSPIDPVRRARFEAFLDEILDIAFTYGPLPDIPSRSHEMPEDKDPSTRQEQIDDEPMTLTAACIACQGDCCTQGRTKNAFLTVHTLLAVQRADPDITKDALREAYLSRLPERSVRRSCIYHGAQGCTLPRTIRSGVCNRWECRHRKRLRAKLDETGARHVVVAGIAQDHSRRPQAGANDLRVVAVGPDVLQIHEDLQPEELPARAPDDAAKRGPAPMARHRSP